MEKQYNEISGKVYEGRNQAELLGVKEKNNYKSNSWLTFLQAKEKGLKIKKGSKGVSIFKGFRSIANKETKGGKEEIKVSSIPMGFHRVFNLDQTEKFNNK